jgi:hypothetical protein
MGWGVQRLDHPLPWREVKLAESLTQRVSRTRFDGVGHFRPELSAQSCSRSTGVQQRVFGCLLMTAIARIGCCTSLLYGTASARRKTAARQSALAYQRCGPMAPGILIIR